MFVLDTLSSSYPLFLSFLFFPTFIFISWRLITLHYCSGFCHTISELSLSFWDWLSVKCHSPSIRKNTLPKQNYAHNVRDFRNCKCGVATVSQYFNCKKFKFQDTVERIQYWVSRRNKRTKITQEREIQRILDLRKPIHGWSSRNQHQNCCSKFFNLSFPNHSFLFVCCLFLTLVP